MERKSSVMPSALIIAAIFMFIFSAREAAAGASAAVMNCITVIIPSLFALTVMSKLLISTDIYRVISAPLSPLSRYIFRIPPEWLSVLLISQIAGYPIGAALIGNMYAKGQISKSDGEYLLCFCIAPGPAFIYAVSSALCPSGVGMSRAIFISVTGVNILGAALCGLRRRIPEKTSVKVIPKLSSQTFISSVEDGSKAMMMICAVIVFAGAALGCMEKTGLFSLVEGILSKAFPLDRTNLKPLVRAFFEISNLTAAKPRDIMKLIPAAAMLLSFGGICVHMQISALCGGLSPAKAFTARIPCSAAAYFLCRSLLPEFSVIEASAVSAGFGNGDLQVHNRQYTPILSVFLLIMTILIISQKRVVKR